MLVGAGAAGSSVDAANILKPALARGELQCVGATTMDEYRKHIESDPALERRLQPVMVEEPTVEETVQILQGIRSRYEEYHKVRITDKAIVAAVNLAVRYVPDRFLPDKAIDLIDEASSRVRTYKAFEPAAAKTAFLQLQKIRHEAEQAQQARDLQLAQELLLRESELKRSVEQLRLDLQGGEDTKDLLVTEQDVAEIVAMWTGIPVAQIAGRESERLLHMEQALHGRIVGQDEAINTLSKAVRRARAGMKDPRRPIGSFLFLGPTGVGKTELAKALAEFMFGSEDALLQLDMSEFTERHSIARLVGAPPGYVGYDDAGQLTEAIRRRPYSVVCFDEVEKAHSEAVNILLQIMEDGHLSDARGRRVDFRNAIVIMTSNIGAELLTHSATLGFVMVRDPQQAEQDAHSRMKDSLMGELKRTFRPEFLNRIDDIVVFHNLTRDHIEQIVDIKVAEVGERLKEQGVTLELTPAAREKLADEGYNPEYGARPLRQVIRHRIEDPLCEGLLAGEFVSEDTVQADSVDGEIVLAVKSKSDAPDRVVASLGEKG